ncbi:hypothetical protein SAMN06309944_0698 [Micrococcales bacterium KH10]|nr:hypothetical protein SAMN06309944_0698 [Micrococcales bacterium KH10]
MTTTMLHALEQSTHVVPTQTTSATEHVSVISVRELDAACEASLLGFVTTVLESIPNATFPITVTVTRETTTTRRAPQCERTQGCSGDEISGVVTLNGRQVTITLSPARDLDAALTVVTPARWWDARAPFLAHLTGAGTSVQLRIDALTDLMEATG